MITLASAIIRRMTEPAHAALYGAVFQDSTHMATVKRVASRLQCEVSEEVGCFPCRTSSHVRAALPAAQQRLPELLLTLRQVLFSTSPAEMLRHEAQRLIERRMPAGGDEIAWLRSFLDGASEALVLWGVRRQAAIIN